MPTSLRFARIFFAVAIAFFALQYLWLPHWAAGLPPVAPGVGGTALLVRAVGLILLLMVAGLFSQELAMPSALGVGLIYTASAVIFHGRHGAVLLRDGNLRTGLLEALALGGAALALAATAGSRSRALQALGWAGVALFAFCMLVFGEQHFEFARFVAPIIPRWIPQHLLWTRLTGAAMIAAGVAFFVPRIAAVAGALLGLMFLLWFALLHLPRCFAAVHALPEWTSAGVALGMAGAAWIVTAFVRGVRLR